MTRLLAAAGYDMIGVDNSEEMLEIAREAEYEADAWSAAAVSYTHLDVYKRQVMISQKSSLRSRSARRRSGPAPRRCSGSGSASPITFTI